ncbi:MAG: gliding motility-associated C-terminal domain-containing protein [Bacteroidota bacterium]
MKGLIIAILSVVFISDVFALENGCPENPKPDLVPSIISVHCLEEKWDIHVCFTIQNISTESDFDGVLNLIIYGFHPWPNEIIEQYTLNLTIPKDSSSNLICYTINTDVIVDPLYLAINASGNSMETIKIPDDENIESNYSNNIDSLLYWEQPTNFLTETLGPDQKLCPGDSIVLSTHIEFSRYRWSNGSEDSVLVVTEPGMYSINASDYCANNSRDTILIESIPPIDTLDFSICPGDSIQLFQEWYFASDSFYINPSTDESCDSVIWIQLSLDPAPYSSFDTTICPGTSIEVNGNLYFEAGSYIDFIHMPTGCDSMIEFTILQSDPIFTNQVISMCEGGFYSIGEFIYSDSAMDTIPLTTENGCDSLIYLDLTVHPNYITEIYSELCEGDSIFINGVWLFESDVYVFDLSSEEGCDSIVEYHLDVVPPDIEYEDFSLCDGDTLQINGNNISEPGIYTDTLMENGCIIIKNSNVVPSAPTYMATYLSICPEDTLQLGSQTITQPDTVLLLIPGENECDTIHTYLISFEDLPLEIITEIDCENEVYYATVEVSDEWGILWNNGDTHSTTEYFEEGQISVDLNYQGYCNTTLFTTLSPVPDFNSITIPNGIVYLEDNVLEISLELDSSVWSVLWNTSAQVNCDSCLSVEIYALEDSEVFLTLEHISGCIYTEQFTLVVPEQNIALHIPNIFSPNEDSNNDVWEISHRSFSNIEVNIYDRWGNLVHNSKGKDSVTWNGFINSRMAAIGVYIYHLSYTLSSGEKKELIGDVVLMR